MISNDIFPLKPSVREGTCRKYDCACYALFTQGHSYVPCRQMKKRQTPALRRLRDEYRSHLACFWHLALPTWAARVQQPGWSRLSVFLCHTLSKRWWATRLGAFRQQPCTEQPVLLWKHPLLAGWALIAAVGTISPVCTAQAANSKSTVTSSRKDSLTPSQPHPETS